MKFLVAFVAIVAVASAGYLKPVINDNDNIEAIIAAINHPSTDPATAVLLEQQLFQILGIPLPQPEEIAVGPAIIDEMPSAVVTLPALIDFPVPDGGVVTAVDPTPVAVSPVVVGPAQEAPASTPLVQIILNINAAGAGAGVVAVDPMPVIVPEVPQPTPVHVVDVAVDNNPIVPEPVIVVETPSEPVVVVETPPEPVLVAEPTFPVIPEPVIIPEPILVGEPAVVSPIPAVVVPESLN